MTENEENSGHLAKLTPDGLETLPGTTVTVGKDGHLGLTGHPPTATLTEVAAAAAKIYEPDKKEEVDRVVMLLKQMDTPALKLLDMGVIEAGEAGFDTTLEPLLVQMLAETILEDREMAKTRAHEIELARIQARGPVWVEVVKIGGVILVTFLATYFGLKGGS